MSKGYPSCRRVRRAFEWGVHAGNRGRREADNPYKNEKLRELWYRGLVEGLSGRRPKLHGLRFVRQAKGNAHLSRGGSRG